MRIKLPNGPDIAVSPLFFWEKGNDRLLKIQTAGTFHPRHVTTKMSLRILADHLRHARCQRLVDVGCGAGILALVAARLGVPLVVGVDIDHRSIRQARKNAQTNRLESVTRWVVGSADALGGSFDCVLANLPWGVMFTIWEDLIRLLTPHGHLIISGMQDVHWFLFREKWEAHGFHVVKKLSGDLTFNAVPPSGSFTWLAIELTRGGSD